MIVVYHVDDEIVYFNNGSSHVVIPPRTPVEVASDYDARVLLNEKAFHGLVEVLQTRTQKGVEYDLESAADRAEKALAAADEFSIRSFVEGQFEDRIKAGKPALPPAKGSRMERLVNKYKVNFKDQYGLDVTSIATAQAKLQVQRENAAVNERLQNAENEAAQLRQQNIDLAAALLDINKKLEVLAKK